MLHDGVRVYVSDNCILCGRCADVFPAGALEMTGHSVTVNDVMQEVMADRAFYANAGGVIFSGGEPLLQREFTAALLARRKSNKG